MKYSASLARIGWLTFLSVTGLFLLLPLYVMLVTAFKPAGEIAPGHLLSWPIVWSTAAWREAWSSACTGVDCRGLSVGFVHSLALVGPATAIPVALGALTGYLLAFWRSIAAQRLFTLTLAVIFVPGQVFIYPWVKMVAAMGMFGSTPGLIFVHTVFGLPVLTLLFRQFFVSLPCEIFLASRLDGVGFWRFFLAVMLPAAWPMVLAAVVMQLTGVWNDYLLGLIFADRDFLPMTVQLNNIVNTTTGSRPYNVNMAATLLTSALPLLVYIVAGKAFVRGLAGRSA